MKSPSKILIPQAALVPTLKTGILLLIWFGGVFLSIIEGREIFLDSFFALVEWDTEWFYFFGQSESMKKDLFVHTASFITGFQALIRYIWGYIKYKDRSYRIVYQSLNPRNYNYKPTSFVMRFFGIYTGYIHDKQKWIKLSLYQGLLADKYTSQTKNSSSFQITAISTEFDSTSYIFIHS